MADRKYSKVYKKSSGKIKEAIKDFRNFIQKERKDIPLYKINKKDADYKSKPKDHQKCGNCKFACKKLSNDKFVCSLVKGRKKA